MSKPIACVLMMVSLLSPAVGGCLAEDGSQATPPTPTREGPRGDVLAPARDDEGRAPSPPRAQEQATTAEPDDDHTPPRDTGRTASVMVGAGSYAPRTINVMLGDAVEFTWTTGTHTVTSGFRCKADGMFASGTRAYPASYRVTFLRTGIFPFYSDPECATMSGLIMVTAPTSPSN